MRQGGPVIRRPSGKADSNRSTASCISIANSPRSDASAISTKRASEIGSSAHAPGNALVGGVDGLAMGLDLGNGNADCAVNAIQFDVVGQVRVQTHNATVLV